MLVSKLGIFVSSTLQHQLVHSNLSNGLRSGLSLDKAINLLDVSAGPSKYSSFPKAVRLFSNSVFVRPSISLHPPSTAGLRSIQYHRNVHTLTRFQTIITKSDPNFSLKTLSIPRNFNQGFSATLHTTSTESSSTRSDKASHPYEWIDEVSFELSTREKADGNSRWE